MILIGYRLNEESSLIRIGKTRSFARLNWILWLSFGFGWSMAIKLAVIFTLFYGNTIPPSFSSLVKGRKASTKTWLSRLTCTFIRTVPLCNGPWTNIHQQLVDGLPRPATKRHESLQDSQDLTRSCRSNLFSFFFFLYHCTRSSSSEAYANPARLIKREFILIYFLEIKNDTARFVRPRTTIPFNDRGRSWSLARVSFSSLKELTSGRRGIVDFRFVSPYYFVKWNTAEMGDL